MKTLILSCLAAIVMVSFVGCSSNRETSSTTTDQSASMTTDTKDMHPVQQ